MLIPILRMGGTEALWCYVEVLSNAIACQTLCRYPDCELDPEPPSWLHVTYASSMQPRTCSLNVLLDESVCRQTRLCTFSLQPQDSWKCTDHWTAYS